MVHNDISAIVLVRLVAEIILDPQNKVSTKGQNTPKSVPRLIIQVNLYCVICLHPFFLEMPPYFNIVCYTPAMLNSIVLQKKKKQPPRTKVLLQRKPLHKVFFVPEI